MKNKQQGWHELVASAVLAVITVIYLTKALQLPLPHEASTDLGPGVYPTWTGVVLAIMTAIFAFQSVWKIARGAGDQTETSTDEGPGPAARSISNSVLKVVVAIAFTTLYVLAFEPLGFLIATAVYLCLLFLLFKDGWKPTGKSVVLGLVFGLVSSVVLNAVFVYILSVLLPIGLLGF